MEILAIIAVVLFLIALASVVGWFSYSLTTKKKTKKSSPRKKFDSTEPPLVNPYLVRKVSLILSLPPETTKGEIESFIPFIREEMDRLCQKHGGGKLVVPQQGKMNIAPATSQDRKNNLKEKTAVFLTVNALIEESVDWKELRDAVQAAFDNPKFVKKLTAKLGIQIPNS